MELETLATLPTIYTDYTTIQVTSLITTMKTVVVSLLPSVNGLINVTFNVFLTTTTVSDTSYFQRGGGSDKGSGGQGQSSSSSSEGQGVGSSVLEKHAPQVCVYTCMCILMLTVIFHTAPKLKYNAIYNTLRG